MFCCPRHNPPHRDRTNNKYFMFKMYAYLITVEACKIVPYVVKISKKTARVLANLDVDVNFV